MQINLSKSVNLQKGDQKILPGTLRVVDLMLGWEPSEVAKQRKVREPVKERKSGLGRLVSAATNLVNVVEDVATDALTSATREFRAVDVDASAFLVDGQGKFISRVWYGNLDDNISNIHHSGDNLTGKGAFPDETIHLRNLNDIPSSIQEVHFWVNIFSGSQDFGHVAECVAAVVDVEKREELYRFNLTGQYAGYSSILLCAISRSGSGWIFTALGEAYNENRLSDIIKNHY
jgi:stress response protein SCP2